MYEQRETCVLLGRSLLDYGTWPLLVFLLVFSASPSGCIPHYTDFAGAKDVQNDQVDENGFSDSRGDEASREIAQSDGMPGDLAFEYRVLPADLDVVDTADATAHEIEAVCPDVDDVQDGGEKGDVLPVACGDGLCSLGFENCESCPQDCGCSGGAVCWQQQCCSPECEGKECGDDGCGSVCGQCPIDAPCQDECQDGLCGPSGTADEICNDVDDDCDNSVDEGCDDDHDGFCDFDMATIGVPTSCGNGGGDCNDGDASVFPGASEQCDKKDNDCDGVVDNGLCDDGNPCTDDMCDPMEGCSHQFNAAPCDDGNACTENDHCFEGTCQGAPKSCDDGNSCTDDLCNPVAVGGCYFVNNTDPCDDDGNPCTTDVCENGACQHKLATGIPCDDGNPCTDGDSCKSGQCVSGPPKNCDDGEPCTADSCDPAKGCTHTALTGNACTYVLMICDLEGTCGSNSCVPQPNCLCPDCTHCICCGVLQLCCDGICDGS